MEELQPQCANEPILPDYENENHSIYVKEGILGYTLQIGCQEMYFSTPENIGKLTQYYLDNKFKCIRAYREGGKLKELVKEVLSK